MFFFLILNTLVLVFLNSLTNNKQFSYRSVTYKKKRKDEVDCYENRGNKFSFNFYFFLGVLFKEDWRENIQRECKKRDAKDDAGSCNGTIQYEGR